MNSVTDPPLTPDGACEILARVLDVLGLSAADQDEVLDLVAGKIGKPADAIEANRELVSA